MQPKILQLLSMQKISNKEVTAGELMYRVSWAYPLLRTLGSKICAMDIVRTAVSSVISAKRIVSRHGEVA
jgi:hypothetical protein